jgi:hypothetical protein
VPSVDGRGILADDKRRVHSPRSTVHAVGYYIRYIFDTEQRPKLPDVRALLAQVDTAYVVEAVQRTPEQDAEAPAGSIWADLKHDSVHIGALELRDIEDPGSDDELQALLEELEELDEEAEDASSALWNATGILTVQVLWTGDDHPESLRKLNPLWKALLSHYGGVLQADGEGYYDVNGLFLELD